MTDEKRVVLIKPGDALMIGNVGVATPEDVKQAGDVLRDLGFSPVVFFADDIQIDQLTAEQLRDLTELASGDAR